VKVLAVMGSPRREGDCASVVRILEAQIKEHANAEVEYLFLGSSGLATCCGSGLCITKGEEYCAQKNITSAIKARLQSCDALILASPVYAHQVTALMKGFVDHFAFLFHRPCLVGKPAVVVSTTGGSGLKETLGYLRFTLTGWGSHVVDQIGVCGWLLACNDGYRSKVSERVVQIATRLCAEVESASRRSPTLYEMVFFRTMRIKASMMPADQEYWKSRGWFSRGYYTDVPLNPLKNVVASAIEKVIASLEGLMMKKWAKD